MRSKKANSTPGVSTNEMLLSTDAWPPCFSVLTSAPDLRREWQFVLERVSHALRGRPTLPALREWRFVFERVSHMNVHLIARSP